MVRRYLDSGRSRSADADRLAAFAGAASPAGPVAGDSGPSGDGARIDATGEGAVERVGDEDGGSADWTDGGGSNATGAANGGDDPSVADDGRPAGYEGDEPFAAFEGGMLTLYGKVPSREVADRYRERFGNIVGPENVIDNHTVDPGSSIADGQTTPVYVTDAVPFDFNSIALKPEYRYLLDYGALMLQQNPQATLTIVTQEFSG